MIFTANYALCESLMSGTRNAKQNIQIENKKKLDDLRKTIH